MLLGSLAGCRSASDAEAGAPTPRTSDSGGPVSPESSDASKEPIGQRQVTFTTGDRTLVIEMTDNPTSRNFISRLPMTLEFEDYANTEVIGYLPDPLTTDGSPGTQPSAGDLTLYVPWDNLALFYQNFGSHSDDLIPLGTVVEGADHIAELAGTEVTITGGR
ncbi:hypothetical protein JD276_15065 [Leucobacter sp. CSA1]|uniref:Cyclophilin-like domain-containing protein n=1 Tax=Leucobacter chromiisoli TaxID=2796471 RepID=A0A934UV96_9MICO|nr:cyclophilin-like fold protein [Leucobacter chromiisoli]MBK0420349.1 hypothetical protein [Leucobacter chromiisoli]